MMAARNYSKTHTLEKLPHGPLVARPTEDKVAQQDDDINFSSTLPPKSFQQTNLSLWKLQNVNDEPKKAVIEPVDDGQRVRETRLMSQPRFISSFPLVLEEISQQVAVEPRDGLSSSTGLNSVTSIRSVRITKVSQTFSRSHFKSPICSAFARLQTIPETPQDIDASSKNDWTPVRRSRQKVFRSNSCPISRMHRRPVNKKGRLCRPYSMAYQSEGEKIISERNIFATFSSQRSLSLHPLSSIPFDDDENPQEAIVPSPTFHTTFTHSPTTKHTRDFPSKLSTSKRSPPTIIVPSMSSSLSHAQVSSDFECHHSPAFKDYSDPTICHTSVVSRLNRSYSTPSPSYMLTSPFQMESLSPTESELSSTSKKSDSSELSNRTSVLYSPQSMPSLTPDCLTPTSDIYRDSIQPSIYVVDVSNVRRQYNLLEVEVEQEDIETIEDKDEEQEDLAQLLHEVKYWAWPLPPSHVPSHIHSASSTFTDETETCLSTVQAPELKSSSFGQDDYNFAFTCVTLADLPLIPKLPTLVTPTSAHTSGVTSTITSRDWEIAQDRSKMVDEKKQKVWGAAMNKTMEKLWVQ
ncbi:uncharacterized protein L203_101503 [Cryptococcus depauperatus CBS 7841]|uniref:Uncharacterized protein n=1 Tax=Cryptococcus depauperatus CBS 7841 TaxID=1295531 RepID=A0AAJ8LZB0_9TREE